LTDHNENRNSENSGTSEDGRQAAPDKRENIQESENKQAAASSAELKTEANATDGGESQKSAVTRRKRGKKERDPEEEARLKQTEDLAGNWFRRTTKKEFSKGRVWLGIGLVMILHLMLFMAPHSLYFIGVFQFIYILPALYFCRKDPGLMQGVATGAVLTIIGNAAFFGLMLALS
jgi:hypothetical protein